MRVLNVCSSLDLKTGGGTAERTFQMSRFLGRQGSACTVLTLRIGLEAGRIGALAPATVVAIDCLWRRFYVPNLSWKTVYRLVDGADIVHLIGHWGVLNAVAYLAARFTGKPYVVCPAGALPLFGRSTWLKRIYNLLLGKAMIRNAAGWIAVTPGEFSHFESYGIPATSVTVIPNGVFEGDFTPINRTTFLLDHGLSENPVILFMGRLNPIKGPDLLLDAFALVSDRLSAHQLIFAGPDGGMLADLCIRAEHLGLAHRVHFLGHVEGDAKSGAYRCAQLLVVPSRQEAMSIVALEAGICGTPVLLTDQCGFSDMGTIDKRLEVQASAKALAEGMVSLLADPVVLERISPVWKSFVMSNYDWEVIAPRYLCLYRKILARKDMS
jgi:glycosyltransferase involved in cell wall biosynthesis